jgi:antitoxin (DNA-binding transcriptional repressor) of toxin-antitoxin stability system
MQTVDIQQAKTQLSKLADQADNGESFIIAKAGKPLVKVSKLNTRETSAQKRIGFMQGQIEVPADFDELIKAEIGAQFGAE